MLMEGEMAISTQQLRLRLNADEPDYTKLARLGPAILPQLMQLVQDRNQVVASAAAALAGMIGGPQATQVLARAAKSRSAQVRTAAAGALRDARAPAASRVIAPLLKDSDKNVRKFAIKAAAARPDPTLLAELDEINELDPEPAIRSLAARVLAGSRRY
jgi:HEAT repeat protein